jgi:pimeloyl-ACP methyl ester carboxylesterase
VDVLTGGQKHRVGYKVWKHESNFDDSLPSKTIVCWHGLARNGHDFDILAQLLIKNIKNALVIVPDTPGRGESEDLNDPSLYQLPTYVSVFMEIFKDLGCPDDMDWVGVSMGGLMGMVLSAMKLEVSLNGQDPLKSDGEDIKKKSIKIGKLVLVDIGPEISAKAVERIGSYVSVQHHWTSLLQAESHFKSIYGSMGSDITHEQWSWMARFLTKPSKEIPNGFTLHYDYRIANAFKSGSKQEPENSSGSESSSAEEGPSSQTSKPIELWNLWHLIQPQQPSIMLYHGEQSDVLSFETVKKMQSTGPGVQELVSFPQYGHTPHLFSISNCNPIIRWLSQ